MAEVELTHLPRVQIDIELATAQHAAYCSALAATGSDVTILPGLDDYPDCTFVEDVLVSLPEIFILTRPGAHSRRGEVAAIEAELTGDKPVAHIVSPGTLDGGDLLAVGKIIFIGRSTRTNDAGIAQLAQITAPFGYHIVKVEVPGALHLKTAVTALSSDLIVINPNWANSTLFGDLHRIEVHPDEPFAGNSLSIAGRVFMQANHDKTAQRIAAAGFVVELLDISEFAKAEAGLTCMSVLLNG